MRQRRNRKFRRVWVSAHARKNPAYDKVQAFGEEKPKEFIEVEGYWRHVKLRTKRRKHI